MIFNGEIWRIIGVFPTDDGTGNIENRIKIIKDQSIGEYEWKTDSSNNWTGATLNTELNTTYLNSLDSTSKSMIGQAKYYLGGKNVTYNNGYADTPLQFYSYERKIQNGTNCVKTDFEGTIYLGTECYYYGTNPNSFIGKLGLMYFSDYGYASSNCENKRIYDENSLSNDIRACNTTNWLLGNREWLLPQLASDSHYAFVVHSDGRVDFQDGINQHGVRPVLYLISSAKITGGDGTIGSPYILGV